MKILTVAILIGVWAVFHFYDLPARTSWGVEESFMYWGVKNVAVDHNYPLIGRQFFSLVEGPVYRTPFYDWFMGSALALSGFRIMNFNYLFLAFSLASVFCIFGLSRKLAAASAAITGVLWVFSVFIRQQEMGLWNVSLMIPLTSVFLYYWFRSALTAKRVFIAGLILGLGFSLHLVMAWLVVSVIVYLLLTAPKKLVFCLAFAAGASVDLLPLLIFNLRHDFVMRQGLINLFTGQNSGYSATLPERLLLVKNTLALLAFAPLLPVIGLVVLKKDSRKFALLGTITLLTTLAGLFLSGRTNFSSLHYTLYLIPFTVVCAGLLLASLRRRIVVVLIVIYALYNLNQWWNFRLNSSYESRLATVNRILDKYPVPINIKVADVDVLAYDAIFYEALSSRRRPYSDVNLMEKWVTDKDPDILLYSNETVSDFRRN